MALAAACAPTEPTVRAADQEPPIALVSAPSKPMAADANAKLAELIEGAPKSVAGERLNVELLRRFYARRGFAPVWETRQAQANSLMDAISRAGNHGLAPELFLHADLLRSPATLPALERELLLSNAFLSYADALARGAVPVERRRDDETLTPEAVDVAAALDAAIGSPDPAAVIEGLAPATPTYRMLRQALQDKTATTRLREIRVNLERERWLPRPLPADRVWVNVADGRLVLYRDDQPVFSTRVIVGMTERRNQSPELQTSIDGILVQPTLERPEGHRRRDAGEGPARPDLSGAAQHGRAARWRAAAARGGHLSARTVDVPHEEPVRRLPARYAVKKSVRPRRPPLQSWLHRVEDPRKLAALLMRQPIEAIDKSIATGSTNWGALPKPVPVFVVYETAFADGDGRVAISRGYLRTRRRDFAALDPKRRAVAERKAPDQRGR